MRFWILLLLLGWRMRWLAKHNDAFKEKLANKDTVLQLRTASGKVARYYLIKDEQVAPHGGVHAKPTICLSFRDAKYAYETIMKAGKDQMVFMKGMGTKDIVVTGDPAEMMWFMSLMTFLPPKKKKK